MHDKLDPENLDPLRPGPPGVKAMNCHFDYLFARLQELVPGKRIVLLTDSNLAGLYTAAFSGHHLISFPAGESNKNQQTVDQVIRELIRMEAGKDTVLVGVGGGVVTDITGFVAAVYMRGIPFGLVPTSILAMVDAAIGGKNGIDVGIYKNLLGTIRQPGFVVYDYSFLNTLPVSEWVNGFAEVIKHACIRDANLFAMLERYSLHDFQGNLVLTAELVEKNVAIKSAVVHLDEFEKGERKILNFGHTIGHAIENLVGMPHGHAISIGMTAACNLSEKMGGLHFEEAKKVIRLLAKYHLPVDMEADHEKVFDVIRMDKKREGEDLNFILIDKIGHAFIMPLALETLRHHLKEIL
jgi:3-dehydroquinate synthase